MALAPKPYFTPGLSKSNSMSLQNEAPKFTGEVTLRTFLLLQIGVGTVANVILFFHNVSRSLVGPRLRPTQVILPHMAVANSLALLSAGSPHIMTFFVAKSPLSDIGCKLVYYTRRVARGTTLCSTCVLSTCQHLTLSSGRLGRVILRGGAPSHIGSSCCLCWVFSLLSNIYILIQVTGPRKPHNGSKSGDKWFCSATSAHMVMDFLLITHDAVFIGLMGWTSGSMVLLLYRHHQRMKYILTSNQNHRVLPETRAAHTVLMLVVTFVSTYVLNSICAYYFLSFVDAHWWFKHVIDILASAFPFVSAFMMLSRDPRAPGLCS